jgi:outer membrane immunogenic protein
MFKEIYNQVCMMKFNKSLLLISIGLIITSTQAVLAEDAMSKSTFDWTGVYVGGFVGGATGANVTNKATNSPKLFGVIPQGSSSTSANSSTSGTFMGGGTVGYNWQIPKTPYLIGLEGEYGYLGSSGSSQSQSVGPLGLVSLNTQNKTTIGSDYGYGLVGGRLGYALDRSLFYVKSGAVFTQVNSTNSTNTSIAGSPFNTAGSSNSGGTTTGYAIGGGVEFAPSWYGNQNVTVKVEYLYFGIPTTSNSSQNSSSQPFSADPTVPLYTENSSYQNSTGGISTAKIGVNYKF